ncbi:MAG TPA: zinc ABC transporter substrate-binding protein [Candidatus Hydrogenedens sp.]|nr:zinc ABC transporter substrate-binding protein [Candidatus Hydrogenedens sp.]
MKTLWLFVVICNIALIYICVSYPGWTEEATHVYYAGIPPIGGILDNLALADEKVKVIGDTNRNPHTFDISPSELQKLTHAQIFFHTHFPYELKIVNTLKEMNVPVRCVDVTDGIVWRSDDVHQHNTNDDYEHGDINKDKDLHCWLSPNNLKIISTNIYKALIDYNPSAKDSYQAHYEKWIEEIEHVHTTIQQKLTPFRGKSFFVYHPAFGYFLEVYGLHEVCIEMEGKSPSPKQLRLLMERMQKENSHIIFVQPQFDPKPAEMIAKGIGGKVEIVNDFERNVLNNLLNIAEKISLSYSNK